MKGYVPANKYMLIDNLPDPFGGLQGLPFIDLPKDDEKFLATIPTGAVKTAQDLPKNLGQLDQDSVADQMTMTVIDPLEIVDIDHQ